MPYQENYEKISPTARYVAYIRTFTDIPFAREIAVETGAEKDFQIIGGRECGNDYSVNSPLGGHATRLRIRLSRSTVLHRFWRSPPEIRRAASPCRKTPVLSM